MSFTGMHNDYLDPDRHLWQEEEPEEPGPFVKTAMGLIDALRTIESILGDGVQAADLINPESTPQTIEFSRDTVAMLQEIARAALKPTESI